jgi:membrane protein DedA with SNARE-associated domain
MVAGMLDLPVAKFVVPNIIGCLLAAVLLPAGDPGRRGD